MVVSVSVVRINQETLLVFYDDSQHEIYISDIRKLASGAEYKGNKDELIKILAKAVRVYYEFG